MGITSRLQLSGNVGRQLERVENQVQSQALCGASSVDARLSNLAARRGLSQAQTALNAAGFTLGDVLPSRRPLPSRRLSNGSVVAALPASGNGRLRVRNGRALDGVVALVTNDGGIVGSMYVQARSSFDLDDIPDGTYRCSSTLGRDWDAKEKVFTRNCDFTEFEDEFPYVTTETATTITYPGWEISLHPVPGGKGGTRPVDPARFPRL